MITSVDGNLPLYTLDVTLRCRLTADPATTAAAMESGTDDQSVSATQAPVAQLSPETRQRKSKMILHSIKSLSLTARRHTKLAVETMYTRFKPADMAAFLKVFKQINGGVM